MNLPTNRELDLRQVAKLGPITCQEDSRKLVLEGEKERTPGLFLTVCLGIGAGITLISCFFL